MLFNIDYNLWDIWFNDTSLYFWVLSFLVVHGEDNYPKLESYRKILVEETVKYKKE